MLIPLGARQAPSGPEDPVDLLLACHGRIRRFSALALRLGVAEEVQEVELRDAAAAVLRYFREALPLHTADEDESIRPRLLAAGEPAPALARALLSMSAEHLIMAEAIDDAAPLWEAVERDPGAQRALRPALQRAGARIEGLFDSHLGPEEEIIFPALRHLGEAELAAILAEMRERRRA